MSTEILCVGDIHLGREPGRVPDALLEECETSRSQLSAAGAWKRTVREALSRKVSAVLLAGDVVDSDDNYLSAYGPLAAGVRDLIRAGIAVIAVAGNHDTVVLPRLAREIDGLRLLGANGTWDHQLIFSNGRPIARVVGWSFPRMKVNEDPLETLPPNYSSGEFEDGVRAPVIGLVHGDLDATKSSFAPLSRKRLEAANFAAWLLGHVHKPHELNDERPLGYLGCLSGNDPGEAGVRGPWIARLESDRVALEQLPLAPLRFEFVEVDVDGVQTADQLERCLTQAIQSLDRRRSAEGCLAAVVGVRPILIGCTSLSARRRAEVLRTARDAFYPGATGSTYFFDHKAHDRARPLVNLAELSHGSDPPAVLAQILIALEEDSADGRGLIDRTRARMQDESKHSNFTGLPIQDVTREAARAALIKSGRVALEELLEQRMDQVENAAEPEEVHA